ncbi:MAG: choice-of-anchor Q domain-containing protein, partial [Verrucomicrobiota bacterium]
MFDGRYVYFVPDESAAGIHFGKVLRYDTSVPFHDTLSWEVFDANGVGTTNIGFRDAVYDGRYVYFIPYGENAPAGRSSEILRYDTDALFTTNTSWTFYDLQDTGGPGAKGFSGGVFDGRYLYLVPDRPDGGLPSGTVLRYDSEAAFTTNTSWTSFDASNIDIANGMRGFSHGVFDGQYIYFVPYNNTNGNMSFGKILRYNVSENFTNMASWSFFDATTLDPGLTGYREAVFDGQYLYFVPFGAVSNAHGKVLRYDTASSFTSTLSWAFFDAEGLAGGGMNGFEGGVYDGRYVHFTPFGNPTVSARFLSFDTMGQFTNNHDWHVFDLGVVDTNFNDRGFSGGIFDGRFVYFPPFRDMTDNRHGHVLRYDTTARTNASYRLDLVDHSGGLIPTFRMATTGGVRTVSADGFVLSNAWNQVVVGYSGTSLSLHVNSMLLDSEVYPASERMLTNKVDTTVGGLADGTAPFSGGVDELRISLGKQSPDWITGTWIFQSSNNSAAIYKNDPHFFLDLKSTTNGTLNATDGLHPADSIVTVHATPAPGYRFSHWTGDVFVNQSNNNPVAVVMNRDRFLFAHFAPDRSPIHYVATNGSHIWPYTNAVMAATNIQTAIDEAEAGDRVLVDNGVYSHGSVIGTGAAPFRVVVPRGISLESRNGATGTFIRGNSPPGPAAVRGVYLAEGARLVGFTLTNCATRMSGDMILDRSGGGVWASESGAVIDCRIIGNRADRYGGGVFGGIVSNSFLTGNDATAHGGGVASGLVWNCLLIANGGSNGGGVHGGFAYNSHFEANIAFSMGGGAHHATLENCTLIKNIGTIDVGGVFGGQVNNSIIYSNLTTGTHSNWFGLDTNSLHNCTRPDPGGAGTITNPPGLRASNDFRLTVNSPCIDAGRNRFWMSEATDLDGVERIQQASVDIGAYEWRFNLVVRLYLEGAFDTTNGVMKVQLGSERVPLISPYEVDRREVNEVPANAVDWVLVQIRPETNAEAIVSFSAFVNDKGFIQTEDASFGIPFDTSPGGTNYIVIKHRNHLAIMSASGIVFDSQQVLYDFT